MKKIILALLLFPATAFAADCEHSQPHDLSIDLTGISRVVFETGAHDLDLKALADGATPTIKARACASDADDLERLQLTQRRDGDTLVVHAERKAQLGWEFNLFGHHPGYLVITARLPANMPLRLDMGSGDAAVSGFHSLDIATGSGDVRANTITGPMTLSVGSGDAVVDDVGRLRIGSVGSGDVSVSAVRGPLQVGSIGSGDFDLSGSEGDVEIGSIGSGDAVLHDVSGSIRIGSIGSGDVDARNVGGDLIVRSVGSGDVEHSGVTGTVDLPPED